jgi:hypothetical protein
VTPFRPVEIYPGALRVPCLLLLPLFPAAGAEILERLKAEHAGIKGDGIRIRYRRLDSFLEASRRSYR